MHSERGYMDIQMSKNGDLMVTETGDINITDSVAQKIKIRLGWHLAEWQWDIPEGLPYHEYVFVKNPDIEQIEKLVREKIYEVEEVTEVKNVSVTVDVKHRKATIYFVAYADTEIIKEELEIWANME